MSEKLAQPRAIQPLTVGQLVDFVRKGWKTIAVCVLVSLVGCLIWIALSPRTYQAVAIFAPVSSSGISQAQQSTLRSLSSLVRPGLGGSMDVPPFEKFQTLLTSLQVATILDNKHPEIMKRLFKPFWDEDQKRWVKPTGPMASVKDVVKSLLGMPEWQPPGPALLQQHLVVNLKIAEDNQTGLLTITYESGDPVFAAQVLTWTCEAADGVLRKMARERTNARIAYLKTLIPDLTISNQRDAIIDLLSQQEQNSMVIEADPSYAAEALVMPSAGNRPTWPKPQLMFIASVMIGFFAGVALRFIGPMLKLRGFSLLPSRPKLAANSAGPPR